MNRKVRDFLIKFFSGAFGSLVLLAIRGIPPLPGIGSQADHLYVGIGFVVSGGIATIIWQAGDDAPIPLIHFRFDMACSSGSAYPLI
ncbi:MAG: hypothetical protein WA198_03890 [Candidatus Sulfotelmatobacter sp.]